MKAKVKNYIQKFHMIEPGEHLIVGVSGGADSVCLLFLLCKLADEIPFSMSVVHINHMIRQSAMADEMFVQELCQRWKLPFYAEHVAVKELAQREGISEEEAGRQARFETFHKIKEQLHADKIALAHHRLDQAETVLFHLSRGCGIEGLVGIRPVRDDIIHPLLCVSREEIEAFLQKEGLTYVTDETNAQVVYRRNILRHKVLPVLNKEICSESAEHIAKTAEICLEAADYLKKQTLKLCDRILVEDETEQNGRTVLISEDVKELHPYMQKSIIHEAIARIAQKRKDITAVHIEAVLTLFEKQVGRSANLPYEITAGRTYEGVFLCKSINKPKKQEMIELEIDESGKEIVLEDGRILSIKVFPYEKTTAIEQKTYTKWFDYDRIDGHLSIRTRRTGDYFYLDGTKRQTVKAYMVNNKIPSNKRDEILLIAEKDHVLWMVGYRISNFYKVTEKTDKILEITVLGGENNG